VTKHDATPDRLELVDRGSGQVIATSKELGPTAAIQLFKNSRRPFDEVDIYRVRAGRRELVTGRPHESGLRGMMADAGVIEYSPLQSFEEASRVDDAVMVIEGDYGGQIHATAPIRLVACAQTRLDLLARELEAVAWPSLPDADSVNVLYERLPVGALVAGGMGGGVITDGIWVHEEFRQLGLAKAIADVVQARETKLPSPQPDVPPELVDRVVTSERTPSHGCLDSET